MKRHFRVEAARREAKAALAKAGLTKVCVVLESDEGRCKRVPVYVFGNDAMAHCQAMADAQTNHPGWTPVGVE